MSYVGAYSSVQLDKSRVEKEFTTRMWCTFSTLDSCMTDQHHEERLIK